MIEGSAWRETPHRDGTMNLDEMRRLRREAAHRRRRIIMDNDGNDCVYHCREATAQALLANRTAGIPGTQIDTLVYASWNAGFLRTTHNTRVGEAFTCKEEGFAHNITADLIAQGTDSVEIISTFCRRNGIEFFYSKRMNDMHDSYVDDWSARYIFPEFKKKHPECLMGTVENPPRHGGWSAVNYACEEVRELAFRFVEEVCRNYDLDGLMLDFFRTPVYFKAHALQGEPVGDEERDLMTGLVQRVREMTEEVALARGRPLLLAFRVPDSADYCRDIGLDLVGWMEAGLIDLLVVSDLFRLNPWEESVRLARRYDVPIYPCLSESRLQGQAKRIRQINAAWRGRAANVWNSGADGIYAFNIPQPKWRLFREMGDPVTLRGLDKVYTTGARGFHPWLLLDGYERYLNRDPVSPERPRRLHPGVAEQVELPVGECPEANGNMKPAVKLWLRVQQLPTPGDLSVEMNGKALGRGVAALKNAATFDLPGAELVAPETRNARTDGPANDLSYAVGDPVTFLDDDENEHEDVSPPGEWIEFDVDPASVRQGTNVVSVLLDAGSKEALFLIDLLLLVLHRGVSPTEPLGLHQSTVCGDVAT